MSNIILCADDSKTMQTVAEITFRVSDFTYAGAYSADEALDKARAEKPALILADAVMPDKSGYDLCQMIKSDPELGEIPVVILCGNSSPYDSALGSKVGADGYLSKPWDTQVMLDKIAELMEKFSAAGTAKPAQGSAAKGAEDETATIPKVVPKPPILPQPKPVAVTPAPSLEPGRTPTLSGTPATMPPAAAKTQPARPPATVPTPKPIAEPLPPPRQAAVPKPLTPTAAPSASTAPAVTTVSVAPAAPPVSTAPIARPASVAPVAPPVSTAPIAPPVSTVPAAPPNKYAPPAAKPTRTNPGIPEGPRPAPPKPRLATPAPVAQGQQLQQPPTSSPTPASPAVAAKPTAAPPKPVAPRLTVPAPSKSEPAMPEPPPEPVVPKVEPLPPPAQQTAARAPTIGIDRPPMIQGTPTKKPVFRRPRSLSETSEQTTAVRGATQGSSARIAQATSAAVAAAAQSTGLDPNGPEVKALLALSKDVVERVVWEIVPELAEAIIRENLHELAGRR